MREITASEASRSFSAVLDQAESGETIIVTRGGRRVATITSAPASSGAALRSVFARWQGHTDLADALAAQIAAARAAASAELDTDPWHD